MRELLHGLSDFWTFQYGQYPHGLGEQNGKAAKVAEATITNTKYWQGLAPAYHSGPYFRYTTRMLKESRWIIVFFRADIMRE
jgi:hypothetical protein